MEADDAETNTFQETADMETNKLLARENAIRRILTLCAE
jgi:hypothetical protein